jgi:hypothetical protein
MSLSPLGLSVGRSAVRLSGIALYLTGLTATLAIMVKFDGAFGTWIGTLANVGDGLIADSNWLLPALLAVNVTLIAVVAAQSITGTEPEQVARTHSVIAAISQTVGAFAVTTILFALISAANHSDNAAHLLPMGFIASLVVTFGLWANVVVFGKPRESLRLFKASRSLAESSLRRLHPPTHTPRQAWRSIAAITLAICAASTLIPIGISSMGLGNHVSANYCICERYRCHRGDIPSAV